MNVDNDSVVLFVSRNINVNKVTSKYFTREHMDDSLEHFQETEKFSTCPKKLKAVKEKPRKASKKVKGQKDIRSALKEKKNDLVAYTEEFDAVCKKSGIDVNSEELQLAIALSKSVQTESLDSNCSSKISRDKTKIIKNKLEEYGFKVPQIKTSTRNRRKSKKNYKLILCTDVERLQVISDKYAQVLFKNVYNFKYNSVIDFSKTPLYYISTNISYNEIKDNDKFYVDGLIEKSKSNGSLLRDWADIPGRPISPVINDNYQIDFNEIECSQDELDIALSGPLKAIKKITKDKQKENSDRITNACSNNNGVKNSLDYLPKLLTDSESQIFDYFKARTSSPDIFEDDSFTFDNNENKMCDEDSYVNNLSACVNVNLNLDTNKIVDTKVISQEVIRSNETERKSNDFIEITKSLASASKCNRQLLTNYAIDLTQSLKISQNSIKSNETKRKSEDFMEITECVASTSKHNSQLVHNYDIDLTQSFKNSQNSIKSNETKRKSNDYIEITDCVASTSKRNSQLVHHCEIDLTQNLKNSQSSIKSKETKRTSNDYVEITDCVASTLKFNYQLLRNDETNLRESPNNQNILDEDNSDIDLTQSSNSSNELPFVQLSDRKLSDNTIIMNPCDYENVISTCQNKKIVVEDIFDLTQDLNFNTKKSSESENSTKDLFEEFVYNHSDHSDVESYEKNNERMNLDKSEDSNDEDLLRVNQVLYKTPTKSISNHDKSSNNVIIELNNPNTYLNDIFKTKVIFKNSLSEANKFNEIDLTQSSNLHEELDIEISDNDHIKNKTFESNSSNNSKDIDDGIVLTQHSSNNYGVEYASLRTNHCSLDKEQIIFIDYDSPLHEPSSSKSTNSEFDKLTNDSENVNVLESSQQSEVFEITDNELNYSLIQSRNENIHHDSLTNISINYDLEHNDVFDHLNELEYLPEIKLKGTQKQFELTQTKHNNRNTSSLENAKNDEFIIKTEEVTPIKDYASMSTLELNTELDKYGLKQFKRKRAIQLLTHVYNQTHPIVEDSVDMESPQKKLKPNISPEQLKSPKKITKQYFTNVYEVTNEVPIIKDIECSVEDCVFQKKEKAKVHSCRVPLHITFHNYVSCRKNLLEAILRYEPVNIDVIHKELASYGYKYDPKDLLRFMDTKCITVKTTDNTGRNKNTV